MAKQLTPEELAKTKADFDSPAGEETLKKKIKGNLSPKQIAMEPKKAAEKKPKITNRYEYWEEVKRREEEAKKQKHAGGRPKKQEEVSVRSFRLSDRTMQRLRILAAFDGISVADVITKLADKAKVPGLDK